jgi:ABC-2 type transport system permease protein
MMIPFKALMAGAMRDRISLFYALIFPVIMIVVLGLFFEDPGYRYHLLIGLVALGSFFFTTTGTGFEVMRQRRQGVYKLLRATPFPIFGFVSTLTAARGLIALVCSLLVYVGGALYYGVTINWAGFLLMIPVMILGMVCFTALGFILGNLGNNETQVAGYNNLFNLPMTFCSPIFYSLDRAPQWVQILAKCLPMSHYLDALKAAQAADASGMAMPLLIVAGFTLATLAVAALTFRWDPDSSLLRFQRA